MTKKQAIKESIKHWVRMINYADTQSPRKRIYMYSIYNVIAEHWTDKFCALCIKYKNKRTDSCCKCPLYIRYGDCSYGDKNLWQKTVMSKTYGSFVRNGKKFIKQLENLLED